MRLRRNDVAIAIALALLLHFMPPSLLWWFSSPTRSGDSAGDPVLADTIDFNALSASTRSALQREPTPAPTPAPPPEPVPVQAPTPAPPLPDALPEDPAQAQPEAQDFLPKPDQEDREEARAESDSPQTATQEQDARHRQGQVDLTSPQRQDRQQQDDNEMQRQRRQQLEDIRRQREAAQREAELASQRLQQLNDARARASASTTGPSSTSPPPGNGGQSRNLQGAYEMALKQAIRSNWTRPDGVPLSALCKIAIRQIPGGTVIEAQVDPSCPYDEAGRRSVEAAVLKAQPLPYRGFESVFARTLTLNFRAEDP